MARQHHLSRMAWPEVERAAGLTGSTVVWPFGAIEQHGPHLPLGTDGLFADRLVEAVLERLHPDLPIWRLPLQSLGFSPEHRGFAGTLTLPAELLIAQVVTIGQELAGSGFQRLVLLNGLPGGFRLKRLFVCLFVCFVCLFVCFVCLFVCLFCLFVCLFV